MRCVCFVFFVFFAGLMVVTAVCFCVGATVTMFGPRLIHGSKCHTRQIGLIFLFTPKRFEHLIHCVMPTRTAATDDV